MKRLDFSIRSKNRTPRASIILRAGRLLRRKRVQYERDQVEDTLKHLRRQIAQMYAIAKTHGVPLDPMAPLPALPDLPGREWVEFLADMGDLKAPVKSHADPRDAVSIAWNGPEPT